MNINQQGRKDLNKSITESITVLLYKDKAVVTATKMPLRKPGNKNMAYEYIIHSEFVYNGMHRTNSVSFKNKQRALNYAEDIFHTRNCYMCKNNYTLEGVGLV